VRELYGEQRHGVGHRDHGMHGSVTRRGSIISPFPKSNLFPFGVSALPPNTHNRTLGLSSPEIFEWFPLFIPNSVSNPKLNSAHNRPV
jgi:hypothetical protein